MTQARTFEPVSNQVVESTLPTGTATALMDVSRNWSLALNVNRDVTVLEGLSPQAFSTDAATLTLTGTVQRRLILSVASEVSRGGAVIGTTGAFDARSFVAQAQYGMANCCSLITSYTFYQHELTDIIALPAGYPPEFNRHSLRLGFSLWLPLYGTF
jgi:hypothetical protein